MKHQRKKEFSGEASGHSFTSSVSKKGVSLVVGGVELLKDATAQEAQELQRVIGLASHRLLIIQKEGEAAQKKSSKPSGWQEKHSPTDPIETKVGHNGKTVLSKARQRKADKRIQKGLNESQLRAMDDIDYGFNYVTRELGSKISSYEKDRVQGTGPNTDKGEKLYFCYKQWAREGERHFDVDAVKSIVIDGQSLRRVAFNNRTGQSWPKKNLVVGLDAYCKLRRVGGHSY